jgi:hypothetical protein
LVDALVDGGPLPGVAESWEICSHAGRGDEVSSDALEVLL